MKVTRHHNLVMEENAQWDGKQKQLNCIMNLCEHFRGFRDHGCDDRWIIMRFPEMAFLCAKSPDFHAKTPSRLST